MKGRRINKENNRNKTIIAIVMMVILFIVFAFSDNKELQKEVVKQVTNTITDIATYEMTDKEVEELPTTEIQEKTEDQEKEISKEQEVEDEGFELQGNIAYEGDRARSWNIELGNYKGLTYYSQIDNRWSNKMYSSINNRTQTIGTSGCGPTSVSMIVTACKGTITPDKMSDLFVKYGYRSSNQGTYWSAFRAVADEFNIRYTETSDIQKALQLLRSNHYVVVSVGNGLFTTGGHFIVLTKLEGNTIQVYDPYLYAGKFETSTRRGKVTVRGNTVYVTVDNFKTYANAKMFFCYAHDEEIPVNNNKPVVTANYTRYVNAKIGLNIRSNPNGSIIGSYKYGTAVTIYETSGTWSRTDKGWVSSEYLVTNINKAIQINKPAEIKKTVGITKKLSKDSILYANSNLTGIKYNYRANTTIAIIENVNSNVDKVRVNATGRIAYINNKNYTNVVINKYKSTVGQTKKLKACTLYSKSNLSGYKYQYKANTTVTVLQHVNSYIDKVKIKANGRVAYINVNSYK